MATNHEKYESSMKNAWENPPEAFNPDYNEETVKRHDQHNKRVKDYADKIDKEQKLTDEEFDFLFNSFNKISYLKYREDSFGKEDVTDFLERRNKVSLEKYGIKEGDIEFTNPAPDGSNHYQDVEVKGEVIGVLISRENGKLNELTEIYQMTFEKKYEKIMENYDISDTSEDEGYLYAQFEELDDLISLSEYIKKDKIIKKKAKKKSKSMKM